MPNPTDSNANSPLPKDQDHEHHKICLFHAGMCPDCRKELPLPEGIKVGPVNTYKRPTYRHTAKPPWVDFEKQRELVPGDKIKLNPPVVGEELTATIGLSEKITTCRITFEDREPDRSESGKAITIHQCKVHLVIITWDESND